jgi:hypothetical protein
MFGRRFLTIGGAKNAVRHNRLAARFSLAYSTHIGYTARNCSSREKHHESHQKHERSARIACALVN